MKMLHYVIFCAILFLFNAVTPSNACAEEAADTLQGVHLPFPYLADDAKVWKLSLMTQDMKLRHNDSSDANNPETVYNVDDTMILGLRVKLSL